MNETMELLRGRAHRLLAELLPEKWRRYEWLALNGPNSKVHCSQMSKSELKQLIEKLYIYGKND